MKAPISRLAGSVWTWALVPTLVIGLLVRPIPQQYTLQVKDEFRGDGQVTYVDLNLDGVSDVVHARPGPPLNNFVAVNDQGNYFEQWNVPDDARTELSPLLSGNYDHDNYSELYLFTTKGDSVFLHVNEILEPTGLHIERQFITRVGLIEGQIDSHMKMIGFHDLDGDGKDEFYFRITSGFSLAPRLCYAIDLVRLTLRESPRTAVNFNTAHFEDLDSDGHPEILSQMTASGNYHTPVPYTDYSAWLMILTDSLTFKFPPREFPGFGGSLSIMGLTTGARKNLLVVYNYRGAGKPATQTAVHIFTIDGKLLKQKPLADLGISFLHSSNKLKDGNNEWLSLTTGDELVLVDADLNVVRRTALAKVPDLTEIADIDQDGRDEILLFHESYRYLTVFRADLQPYGTVELNYPNGAIDLQSFASIGGDHKLYLRAAGNSSGQFLTVKENPSYWLGYLFFPAVYAIGGLFLLMLKRVTTREVERREQQKRKIQTLQLQSIKAQLDPHFTFNALNSVASLLYQGDRNAAYDYLNKFTRLLRQLLNDAERVYRSLDEEIEFVSAYLNLEKLRFGDKFEFTLTRGEGVTGKEEVPVMVLQTFAENAIKHGLMPLNSGGRLSLHMERRGSYLVLTIEDNGVGRKQAMHNNSRQGKGLQMTKDFYELLNQQNKMSIGFQLLDLTRADGTPSGTRVEIQIPVA